MPGGPRIASTDRERIIESYESGEDFLTIAAALNMKRTTAYSIVRHYQITGQVDTLHRGG